VPCLRCLEIRHDALRHICDAAELHGCYGSLPWHSRCSHFGDPGGVLQAASRSEEEYASISSASIQSEDTREPRGGVRSGGRPPCGAYPPRGRSRHEPARARSVGRPPYRDHARRRR